MLRIKIDGKVEEANFLEIATSILGIMARLDAATMEISGGHQEIACGRHIKS
jgi:hypothetical protein